MNNKINTNKPRVIKDYEKLDEAIIEQIKLEYPLGFSRSLIHFLNKEGKKVSALPFETEDKYYLIRMTAPEAREIIENDDDYDDEGILKDEVKGEYEEKYNEDDEELDQVPDADADNFADGDDD